MSDCYPLVAAVVSRIMPTYGPLTVQSDGIRYIMGADQRCCPLITWKLLLGIGYDLASPRTAVPFAAYTPSDYCVPLLPVPMHRRRLVASRPNVTVIINSRTVSLRHLRQLAPEDPICTSVRTRSTRSSGCWCRCTSLPSLRMVSTIGPCAGVIIGTA